MHRLAMFVVVVCVWLAGCEDVEAQTYVGTLRDLGDRSRADLVISDAQVVVTPLGPSSDRLSSIRAVIYGCTITLDRVSTMPFLAWELSDPEQTCETGLVTSARLTLPYPSDTAVLFADVRWSDGPTLADSRHVDYQGRRL